MATDHKLIDLPSDPVAAYRYGMSLGPPLGREDHLAPDARFPDELEDVFQRLFSGDLGRATTQQPPRLEIILNQMWSLNVDGENVVAQALDEIRPVVAGYTELQHRVVGQATIPDVRLPADYAGMDQTARLGITREPELMIRRLFDTARQQRYTMVVDTAGVDWPLVGLAHEAATHGIPVGLHVDATHPDLVLTHATATMIYSRMHNSQPDLHPPVVLHPDEIMQHPLLAMVEAVEPVAEYTTLYVPGHYGWIREAPWDRDIIYSTAGPHTRSGYEHLVQSWTNPADDDTLKTLQLIHVGVHRFDALKSYEDHQAGEDYYYSVEFSPIRERIENIKAAGQTRLNLTAADRLRLSSEWDGITQQP